MITDIEKKYLAVTLGALAICGIMWLQQPEPIEKTRRIPLECMGAESIVYFWHTRGTTIHDEITGEDYHYTRCFPVKDWKGEENETR